MPGIVRTLTYSMLSMDDPDHKRLRDIVDEAFRRRAVLDMEPHI
jgi:cytochrome P450 PksS